MLHVKGQSRHEIADLNDFCLRSKLSMDIPNVINTILRNISKMKYAFVNVSLGIAKKA